MDKQEAKLVLLNIIDMYRQISYEELKKMIDNSIWLSKKGKSGTEYQIQVEAFLDAKENGDIRCVVCIDDGGMISFTRPLCEDFIKNSRNEFIGE
jgi:hypothetical protein